MEYLRKQIKEMGGILATKSEQISNLQKQNDALQ